MSSFLRQNPFAEKLQTQIVSTLKLRKKLLNEKAAHKVWVKLTTGVYVIVSHFQWHG
jgi:hypothetical protein